jgi:hypothetical protein
MDATLAMLHARGILDIHATTQQGIDDNPFSSATDAKEQQQQQQQQQQGKLPSYRSMYCAQMTFSCIMCYSSSPCGI